MLSKSEIIRLSPGTLVDIINYRGFAPDIIVNSSVEIQDVQGNPLIFNNMTDNGRWSDYGKEYYCVLNKMEQIAEECLTVDKAQIDKEVFKGFLFIANTTLKQLANTSAIDFNNGFFNAQEIEELEKSRKIIESKLNSL